MLPDAPGTHIVDALHAAPGVNLVAAFGPEHGFRGAGQAGSGGGGPGRDARTGVPVYSIYGAAGSKLEGIIAKAGVDVLLFDIQDVGTRFYTYIWSLYDVLVAVASMRAKRTKAPRVVVLDRPNPLGGILVEGPTLERGLATFVGRKPICLRHGMTLAELALLFNGEFVAADAGGSKAELDVVPMEGWARDMLWSDTRLRWVPPSPNMPTPATALMYPGMGLVEGTNVSEGRGTTTPFEASGAPWVDDKLLPELASELAALGAVAREAYFVPTFSKYKGETVRGVHLYPAGDPAAFEALPVALAYILAMRRLYPGKFGFRADGFFDKLAGTASWRPMIEQGAGVDELLAIAARERDEFIEVRQRYLLYKDRAA